MFTQKSFYQSKEWERFRKIIIAERTDKDGFVYCAHCGNPIVKKYDLIVHHIQELDDSNVNDFNVSLNPENVECIHFKCHNQKHERFGFNKPHDRKVYIIYGAPCAGKSTWVKDVATPNDLIVDMDSIWECVSTNPRYVKSNMLSGVVFDVRDKLYDIIKYRSGRWHNAYVITGGARLGDRQRLTARIGADECILIDTDKDECIRRASTRGENAKEWIKYIEEWFDNYQPDD